MSSRHSLLESIAGLLARTFHVEHGLADLSSFLIGDHGFARLYRGRRLHLSAGSASAFDAKTLIREEGREVRACVYFPDALISRLERHPPQRGLNDENVDAFAVFVEEIDHLLLLAERTRQSRSLSLFEMELHANVSTYLVLSRFLAAGSGVLSASERIWLRHHLFEKVSFATADPAVCQRYREAAHWAVRFLDGLAGLRAESRLGALRRFHEAGAGQKLRMIAAGL